MISILLASYNGERYIAEQIDSLLAQTIQNFKLYICDDKSTDSTWSIIEQYAAKYPEKVFISRNRVNSGSPKHNFIRLMIEHKDDYVMLCDQDDVWLPDKIEKTLKKIQKMELMYGASTPILVHTDLKIVDKDLNMISNSYEKTMRSDFSRTSLNSLVIQNTMAGCSVVYNRALADLICAEPESMVMHDWWLILVASALGRVGTLHEPLVLYRQHGNNDTGVKESSLLKRIYQEVSNYDRMTNAVNQTYIQAESLMKLYKNELSKGQMKLLLDYSSIPKLSPLCRLQMLSRHQTYKTGFVRKVAQIIVVLKERRVRE